jgi:hypothetical protein
MSYLQHARRHAAGGSDPLLDLPSAAQSGYLWTQTLTTFAGPGGGGSSVKWKHFQTTDTTTFGTNQFISYGEPPHNTTGDELLLLMQDGAYVAEATVVWNTGTINMSAEIQVESADYLDDGHPTTMGDISSLIASANDGPLMTQSVKHFTITKGDAPGGISLLVNGAATATYSILSASLICHWLGGGIGASTTVY